MLRLVSYTAVRTELGLDDLADINEALKGALDEATLLLEEGLRTTFDQQSYQDTFAVTKAEDSLRLNAGFVTSAGASIVWASTRPYLAESEETVTTGIDLERGLVHVRPALTDTYTLPCFVQATYTAGFAADGGDTSLYDQTEVPGWLKTLAKLHAKRAVSYHPLFKQAEVVLDVRVIEDQIDSILRRRTRAVPWAKLALEGAI